MEDYSDPRSTRRLREWVERFVTEYGQRQCAEDFQSLPPLQRLNIFIRLMGFLLPRLKAMDLNAQSAMQLPGLASLFTGLELPGNPGAEAPADAPAITPPQ